MREREEMGFTLIELIVSISIVMIILAAVASSLMVFYKNGAYTTRRDDHSAGAQLLSGYLDRDFASATAAVTSAPATCPSSVPPSGYSYIDSSFAGLTWTQYTASDTNPAPVASTNYAVVYALGPDTQTARPGVSGLKQLERWYCSKPATGGTATLVDHEVLIQDLSSGNATYGGAASCTTGTGSGNRLTLNLAPFEADTQTAYSYTGCVGTRQQ